jgi:D-serine deaminase-like pyridoxal phosphate-dependent protein
MAEDRLNGLLEDLAPDIYEIRDIDQVLTPALAIYPELVDANILATVRALGGRPDRWRPHIKTAKLAYVLRRYLAYGITRWKCATTLELVTACAVGASDVLFAYPAIGAMVRRVRELAAKYTNIHISALVDDPAQVDAWHGGAAGLFIDINPGMNRTGTDPAGIEAIIGLARAIVAAGLAFRGLHYYDGHLGRLELPERTVAAHKGYDQLMQVVAALDEVGLAPPEVITAGTPVLPCAIAYAPFRDAPFAHTVSPGTIVYNDFTSLGQLPPDYGYRPAALVIATVVSHPTPRRFTCNAGHKAVSADAGVPTCALLGWPEARPAGPSEEHLPVDLPEGAVLPPLGTTVYLLPRHVCPTVNNFDAAVLVEGGRITAVEPVTARGHEPPAVVGSQ